jgi:hypothetical protein
MDQHTYVKLERGGVWHILSDVYRVSTALAPPRRLTCCGAPATWMSIKSDTRKTPVCKKCLRVAERGT